MPTHHPTYRHYEYVPELQIHNSPDDARQRSQDPKNLHELHRTILRKDSDDLIMGEFQQNQY